MPMFFNKFPVVRYDMERKLYSYQNADVVTNVLFRVAIIREVLNNLSSYFEYTIADDEKPEVLADKFYEDPEAHWVILYANEIFDPQYDWPLDSRSFQKYLADKYRPQAEANLGTGIPDFRVVDWTRDTTNLNSVHHYEKIITRINGSSDILDEKRIEINKSKNWQASQITAPFDVYDEMPEEAFYTYDLDGTTVTEKITKGFVTYYDYEDALNEKKRNIKVIKREYYMRILSEFNALTNVERVGNAR
jgi:hypothetical protein